jgi:thymidylate synthase
MNKLDKQYTDLLQTILDYGVEKKDRTGTGTKSIFGYTIRHKMSDGFPLLTTKKLHWKSIVVELLWFLRGDTNIKYLHDNGCHIWDGDYEKSGRTDGELGPIYGKQWRSWEGLNSNTDQIKNLINDLKTNPDSRRLMVNAWNVGELDQMVLPPCHNLFQMYSVEKEGKRHLSIMVNIRSNDAPLGLPFNIASYGLLLEIIAKSTNMTPDELIINIGDAHIYLNQIEGIKEQLTREPYPLPTLKINSGNENWYLLEVDEIINSFDPDLTFKVENYQSHPSIKLPLSN